MPVQPTGHAVTPQRPCSISSARKAPRPARSIARRGQVEADSRGPYDGTVGFGKMLGSSDVEPVDNATKHLLPYKMVARKAVGAKVTPEGEAALYEE